MAFHTLKTISRFAIHTVALSLVAALPITGTGALAVEELTTVTTSASSIPIKKGESCLAVGLVGGPDFLGEFDIIAGKAHCVNSNVAPGPIIAAASCFINLNNGSTPVEGLLTTGGVKICQAYGVQAEPGNSSGPDSFKAPTSTRQQYQPTRKGRRFPKGL